MRLFVKWMMWITIIAAVPVTWFFATKGIMFAILSFFLMFILSDIFGKRHYALCDGVSDIETFNKKLAAGADLNAVGACQNRPLIETIKKTDDVNLIKAMIQNGADVNAEGDSCNALMVALGRRKYEIAELLLSSGAVVTNDNIKNIIEVCAYNCKIDSMDGLQWILINDFVKTVKLFLKYNIDLRTFWEYIYQCSINDYFLQKIYEYPSIEKYFYQVIRLNTSDIDIQENRKYIDLFINKLLKSK